MEILIVLIFLGIIVVIGHLAESSMQNDFKQKEDFAKARSTAIINYYKNEYMLIDNAIDKARKIFPANQTYVALIQKLYELREKTSKSEERNWSNFGTSAPPTISRVAGKIERWLHEAEEPHVSNLIEYKAWQEKYMELTKSQFIHQF
jgi:hypothetical protein